MTQRIKKALQKLIDSRASEWIDEQYVYLGSDDGSTVQVADKPGAYYARQLNGDVIEVYNTANIPPHFNLQVKIGRSRSLPTIWQIIHIRQTFDAPVGFGEVGYHAHQHMHDGGDRLPVDRRQILQLSVFVSNSAGFIVRVNGSIVPTATGLAMVSTQDVDLSSHVITAGAKYVSIETNDSGTLSTNTGTVFASPDIATAANIPAPAAGKYHIAHVLFHEGQTGLLDTDIGIPWPLNSFPVTAGSQINSATADTPLDADKFGFWDVVDSLLKSVTWLNIKATLKTYFDTLYSAIGHSHSAPDAAVVTYTPTTAADWDGSADPGDVDNALDQLAERVTDVESAGAAPELLAYKTYAGGDATTTSVSIVDADATNLAVTFTAPASGKVLVRLTAQSCPATGAATSGNQHQWGLKEGGSTIAGPHTVSRDVTANGLAVFVAATVAFVLTGVTAGSHTYKWAHLSSGGGTVRVGASAGQGPAVMEVWALP